MHTYTAQIKYDIQHCWGTIRTLSKNRWQESLATNSDKCFAFRISVTWPRCSVAGLLVNGIQVYVMESNTFNILEMSLAFQSIVPANGYF
jgi:hypothetical protein